ncbi:hypothetical protein PT974_06409 [Cladobotryum mycophilum]|uniref:CRIB domain-containing protein n=1 Tax=Cladobotryum mycophilum TaxID=491253 RepID=A0ABR0SLJ0_9HYPO
MDSPHRPSSSGSWGGGGGASAFRGHRKCASLTTDDIGIPASVSSQSIRRAKSTIERTRPWTPLRSPTPQPRPQTPQTPQTPRTLNRPLSSQSQSLQPPDSRTASPKRTKPAGPSRSRPPPWDRTVDVVYYKHRQEDPGHSRRVAFESSLVTFHAEHGRVISDSSTLRLPDHIRFLIFQHLITNHSQTKNPISLNHYGSNKDCWETCDFTTLDDALQPLWPYFDVSFGLYADIMLTFLSQHAFHATFSPFVNERLNPLATKWLNKYGPYMRSVALEVDFSRLYHGPQLGAINLTPSLGRIEKLLFDFSASQEKRASSAPLESLVLLCRRYYGRRQFVEIHRESPESEAPSRSNWETMRLNFGSLFSPPKSPPQLSKHDFHKIFHVSDAADATGSPGSIISFGSPQSSRLAGSIQSAVSSGSSGSSSSGKPSNPLVETRVPSPSNQPTGDDHIAEDRLDNDDIGVGNDKENDGNSNIENIDEDSSKNNDEIGEENTQTDDATHQISNNSQIDTSSTNDIANPIVDTTNPNTSLISNGSNGSGSSKSSNNNNTDASILTNQEDPESPNTSHSSSASDDSTASADSGGSNESTDSGSPGQLGRSNQSDRSSGSGSSSSSDSSTDSSNSSSIEGPYPQNISNSLWGSRNSSNSSSSSSDETKTPSRDSGSGSDSGSYGSIPSDVLRDLTFGPSYCDDSDLLICNRLIRLRNRLNSIRMAGFSDDYTGNEQPAEQQQQQPYSYRVAPSTAWPRLGGQKSWVDAHDGHLVVDDHDVHDQVPTAFPEGAMQLPPPVVSPDGTVTLPDMGPLPPRRTRVRAKSVSSIHTTSTSTSIASRISWGSTPSTRSWGGSSESSSELSSLFKVQSQDRSVMQMMMHKYGRGKNLSMRGYAHKMSSSV